MKIKPTDMFSSEQHGIKVCHK